MQYESKQRGECEGSEAGLLAAVAAAAVAAVLAVAVAVSQRGRAGKSRGTAVSSRDWPGHKQAAAAAAGQWMPGNE